MQLWSLTDVVLCYQKCHVINFQSNRFGFGSGIHAMDDVFCTGEEPHIVSCPYSVIGGADCAVYESVGVQCSEYVQAYHSTICMLS